MFGRDVRRAPSKREYSFENARGYERVVDADQTSEGGSWRNLLKLGHIITLFLTGVILMVAHHLFYSHLNEKSTDSAAAELPSFLRDQNNVNFIGTGIAHGVRVVFSMAVGAAFAQLFWESLRSRSNTIQQIDALVKCGDSPFHFSAIRAVTSSFIIFVVSSIASAMALLVIITPGSLTVSMDYQRTRPCTVPTIPPVMDAPFFESGLDLEISTLGILTSDSYLAPLRVDRNTACGIGASACTYNVSFAAPAIECVDISNQTDFSVILNPQSASPAAPFIIWYTSNGSFLDGQPMVLTIYSQDLVKGALQAINCTAHNATYDVGVHLGVDTTTVDVWNTTLHSVVTREDTFLSAYAGDAIGALLGLVFAGPNGYTNVTSIDQLQHNAFFVTTSDGNHTWSEDVPDFPVSYMQNASISLLSGNVNYNFSNETSTNLLFVNSTCASTFTVYVYDPVRLLATYGVGAALAAGVAVIGCMLILRNGAEEKIVFSHIARIALNGRLYYASGDIQPKARVNLEGGQSGRLVPAWQTDEPNDDRYSSSSFESGKYDIRKAPVPPRTSWRGSYPYRHAYGRWAMGIIFLAALVSIILHHVYYNYLNGKPPEAATPALKSLCLYGCANGVRNQAVVSDIGIALAYVAQTLFAGVIAISSMQLFWRRIRSQGIKVSQIDALMNVQVDPFAFTFFQALRASFGVVLLALLAASMSFLSVFTPGAIKVTDAFSTSKGCTVPIPRNLTAVSVFNNTQLNSNLLTYTTPIATVLSSGSFLPPINPCHSDVEGPVQCDYTVEFIAPGFDCEDVTVAINKTAFITPIIFQNLSTTSLFRAIMTPQTNNVDMQVSVQTFDLKRSEYQAVNCTGVMRQYSTFVSHNSTAIVDVLNTRIVSTIQANASQLTTFPATYVNEIISLLTGLEVDSIEGRGIDMTPTMLGNIGTFELDGNMTWRENMTVALEEFAQNASLSLLSGTIFSFDPQNPELLANTTTTCTYTYTAYKYTPYLLFVPYGVAVLATIVCAILGNIAIRRNGIEESMDFSRFLRAVLNEKMFGSKDFLDSNTRLRAEQTAEGDLVPMNSNSRWQT